MTRPTKFLLWTLGAIGAVGIFLAIPELLNLHRETEDALKAFDTYSAALRNQRFEEAYQQCGGQFREAMNFEQFVRLYGNLESEYGSLVSVKRISYEVHGRGEPMYWRAMLDANFVYQKKTLKFEFVLHKEGGAG